MTKLLDQPSSTFNPKFDLVFQIKLLAWKRYAENTKDKMDLVKLYVPPMLFFTLMVLVYETLDGLFFDDGLEPFLVPLTFWIFIQKLVVHLMAEKNSRYYKCGIVCIVCIGIEE